MKASNASWEKQASQRTVRRRLWFMALSTLEWVADSLSASSVEGAPGARLVFVPASESGLGAWLVEARLVASPGIVRRAPFFLEKSMGVNMPLRIMSCNKDGTSCRCAGVSIWTAGLFCLPGLAAPCWPVATGSAFGLEDLPCKTRLLYGDQKHARTDSFLNCWDFGLSHL